MTREDSLLEGLIEDGRPLLMLTAVALLLSGAFAILLAARREFLPHDIAYLGMSASDPLHTRRLSSGAVHVS